MTHRLSLWLLLGGLLITQPGRSQELHVEIREASTNASFRGLSVVNDEIAWASGTKGTVVKTLDGGKTWKVYVVPGMEQADFRTIYAFDERRAIMANVGSPGHILRTEDGGERWTTVYTNTDPETFIDGVAFWNEQDGIAYGDPIKGRMLMLKTIDGGLSWQELESSPRLEPGEASFAASGTGIRCFGDSDILVCTGGTVSRLWHSADKGVTWTFSRPPVVQGKSSTGIFSVAVEGRWMVVGGDFQDEALHVNHHFYTVDQGKTWHPPAVTARGYRECIESLGDGMWITVGPSGVDLSRDDGITWSAFSDTKGLHVIRKARTGTRVLAAGSQGTILRLR